MLFLPDNVELKCQLVITNVLKAPYTVNRNKSPDFVASVGTSYYDHLSSNSEISIPTIFVSYGT